MLDALKFYAKDVILDNLYLHTSRRFLHNKINSPEKPYVFDFFDYSGTFYFFKDGLKYYIDNAAIDFFSLSQDEMISASNKNTADDYILFPSARYGLYKLIDKNGDRVDRILLNPAKINEYLRVHDDGNGIYLYAADTNLWYLASVPDSINEDIHKTNIEFIKDISSGDFKAFYTFDTTGNIEAFKLN